MIQEAIKEIQEWQKENDWQKDNQWNYQDWINKKYGAKYKFDNNGFIKHSLLCIFGYGISEKCHHCNNKTCL
jgi:hypothetical protein